MYENVANTRDTAADRHTSITPIDLSNNIPSPISNNNVYNVTHRIPFFDGNIFKNNNHGTIHVVPSVQ